MAKKNFLTSLRYPFIVIGIAVLGLIIGSFADLSLSSRLYAGDGTILKLLGFIAPLAGLFVISLSGILLFFYYFHSRNKTKRYASYAALAIPLLGGIYYGLTVLSSSMSTTMSILLGIVLGGLIALLLYFLLKKEDPRDYARIGYAYLLAAAFVLGFTYVLNRIIDRPSYSMLILTDEAGTDYASFFRAWYLFNSDTSSFPTTVDSSYYASFPTLSTGLASLGLLLPMACPLHKKTKDKEQIAYWVAFALVFVDGLVQILRGKAFLSDFSFSLLLGAIPSFFVIALTKENDEALLAIVANKAKRNQALRQALRSPSVYGKQDRRIYEEKFSPALRRSIRFKNNRQKSIKKKEGPFFKIDKYHR